MRQYVQEEPELVFGADRALPSPGWTPGVVPESQASQALRLILRRLRPTIVLPVGEVQWNDAFEADVLRALFGGPTARVGGVDSHYMLSLAFRKREEWVASHGVAPTASY